MTGCLPPQHLRRYCLTTCGATLAGATAGSGAPSEAAVVPAGIGRQDQRGDLARRGARRLHRRRGIHPHGRDRLHHARPGRDAARPALGIRGQRRVERAVIGRLVADDVDDRGERRGGRCADWRGRWRGPGRNAAASRRACRPCARSRRRRRSTTPSNRPSTQRMPGIRSSAATKCISLVPGLAKQVSTPRQQRVTRLSAPFRCRLPCCSLRER